MLMVGWDAQKGCLQPSSVPGPWEGQVFRGPSTPFIHQGISWPALDISRPVSTKNRIEREFLDIVHPAQAVFF